MKTEPMKTRSMKKIVLVILCSLFCLVIVSTGATGAIAETDILVKAKYNGSQVQLRWFPLDKELGYEYKLYRASISAPEKRSQLAVLSMATYAEAQKKMGKDNESGLKLLYPFETAENRAEKNAFLGQVDNRLNMVLLLSIIQPEIAQILGQSYIDTSVEKNATYIYTLETYFQKKQVSVKSLYVSTQKAAVMPMAWGLKAHKFPWGVGLKWEGYEAFQGFYIFRAESYAGPYTRINKAPVQVQTAQNPDGTIDVAPYFYSDKTIDKDKTYFYKVQGIDFFGDIGPDSDIAAGKVKIDPRPGVPDRPVLDAQETQIHLQWPRMADGAVMGYHVYRAQIQAGPYTRLNKTLIEVPIESSAKTLEFSDTTVIVDKNYFYTVTSVNRGGFESMRSLAALGVATDTTPPPVVQGLTAVLDKANVQLKWNGVQATDLLGYRVYRTMKPENVDWSLINKNPIAAASFINELTKNLSRYPYYYRITAMDTHFNESAPSEFVKIQLPDLTPPGAPVFSASSVREGQVALTWTLVDVYDFAGYHVFREKAGKRVKLTPTPLLLPSFVDKTPPVGKPLAYTVVALDKTGNQSLPSQAMTVIVRDHINPRIDSFKAEVEKGNVVLTLVSRDKDKAGFDVLRSRNNRDFIKINASRVKKTRFVDEHVLTGKRYFYRAILWDAAGNKTQSVVQKVKVQ